MTVAVEKVTLRQPALTSARGSRAQDISAPVDQSSLVVKSIRIHDRRTSVRLEPEMWDALDEVAAMEGLTIHGICAKVDDNRLLKGTFSSALRVYLLRYYRDAAQSAPKLKARRKA